MRTGTALADKIRAHLTVLYEHRASEVAEQVIRLIEQHASKIQARQKLSWDEKDVILITYPDQFRHDDRQALEVLEEFLLTHGLAGLFRILHLLPFFPSSSDEGFAVIDYRQVRPELGTWEHIKRLSEHFDLMIDFVLNHVSSKSSYFRGYLAGEPQYQKFFIEAVPDPALVHVVRPRSTPLLTPFDTRSGKRYLWTTYSEDQIDLNYAEPAVLLEMLDVFLFYLTQNIRIIRLDATRYLWKKLGTSCVDLPETHEIVKLLRDIVDTIAPGVLLLTETNLSFDRSTNYFGLGDEAHLVYDFALPGLLLEAFLSESAEYLAGWLASTAATPPGTSVVNILACHDGVGVHSLERILPPERFNALVDGVLARGGKVTTRLGSSGQEVPYELNITYYSALNEPAENDPQLGLRRFVAAHAFLLALRGIPAVYVLSLFAMPNFDEGVQSTGKPRAINRRRLTLDEVVRLVADRSLVSSVAFEALKRLVALRIAHPAFHPSAVQLPVDTGSPQLVAFERKSINGDEHVLVVLNVGKTPQIVPEQVLRGRKIVEDWLSPWPELAILTAHPISEDAVAMPACGLCDRVIPPGSVVWWQIAE